MSGLEVNTKKLGEIYKEWRGNESCYDNGRPVFEADELLDFAEFCLKHEANGVTTGKRQSNIPDVIKSVCEKCNTEPLAWVEDGKRFLKCKCGNIKQTVLERPGVNFRCFHRL